QLARRRALATRSNMRAWLYVGSISKVGSPFAICPSSSAPNAAWSPPTRVTFAHLKDRAFAPKGEAWEEALADWRTLPSDADAVFDREVAIDLGKVAPQITWGTSPEHVVGVDGRIPDPDTISDSDRRNGLRAALAGLRPGAPIAGTP